MEFTPYQDLLLKDFFDSRTYNYRKGVILLSFIIFTIIKLEIIPTEISAIGVTLNNIERETFKLVLYVANTYLLLSFVIFALNDYWKYRIQLDSSAIKYLMSLQKWSNQKLDSLDNLQKDLSEISSEVPNLEKIEKEQGDVEKMLSELQSLDQESLLDPKAKQKLKLVDKKHQKIEGYFQKIYEKRKIFDALKNKTNNMDTIFNNFKDFENSEYVSNAENLGRWKKYYFWLIPFIAFLISSYVMVFN